MTTMTKKTRVPGKAADSAGAEDGAIIQVRLDAKTKDRVARFFRRRGLTTNDGMRLLIDHALAGEDMQGIPNAETQKAIDEARAGGGTAIPRSELKQWILGDA